VTTTTALRILGATLLLGLVSIAVLAILERPTPDILELVTSSSLAGLLGVLAPSRAEQGPAPRHRAEDEL
jgi:hypothetical protein